MIAIIRFVLSCIPALLVFLSIQLPAQNVIEHTIEWNGEQSEYLVHVPNQNAKDGPLPVVFVLHGGGGNHTFTMLYTGFNRVANKNDFIAVYPRGEKTGTNLAGKDAFHWADGRGTTPPDSAGIDHVGLIRQIIDQLGQDYTIDPNKIYACGISNGGFMAQRLACELSDKIAAVATVAATFPVNQLKTCGPDNDVAILFINGSQDKFVPTETGGSITRGKQMKGYGGMVLSTQESIEHWLTLNGCSAKMEKYPLPNRNKKDRSSVTLTSYKDCEGRGSIQYYKIIGGGHTWPKENIHVPLTGATNKDISATEEIWKFFAQHSR